jgi:ceramide synthetase
LLFLLLALVQFCFKWVAEKLFFVPLAGCLFGKLQSNAPLSLYKKREAKMEKFAQACVEGVFYSSYFIMGVMIIHSAHWVWPSTEWWVAQDKMGRLIQPLTLDQTTFYVAYASRYLAFFVCIFLERKKKDFWEMVIHHASTVVLIFLSFLGGFVRVGFVIMVLLDFADTFLHVAKACKYTEEGRKMAKQATCAGVASMCADIWFALFATAFTVTRLGMFGYVAWSVWAESTNNFIEQEKYGLSRDADFVSAIMQIGYQVEHVFVCQILISVLFVLMCVWEWFLVIAVWKVLSGAELKDERSDSEGDHAHDD